MNPTSSENNKIKFEDKLRVYNHQHSVQNEALQFIKSHLETFASTKQQRLFIFSAFIISFFCFIFCIAKLHKHINRSKDRYRQYGYFFHPRHETNFNRFLEKLLVSYKTLVYSIKMIHKKLTSFSKEKNSIYSLPMSGLKDRGHENLVFDFSDEKELISIRTVSGTEEKQTEASFESTDNWARRSLKRIHDYLYTKRHRSFHFVPLKNEVDIRRSHSMNSRIGQSKTNVPIILVTDTSRMQTNIIDMENFNPI